MSNSIKMDLSTFTILFLMTATLILAESFQSASNEMNSNLDRTEKLYSGWAQSTETGPSVQRRGVVYSTTDEKHTDYENKPPRTVIVGAGISGLAAAALFEEEHLTDYIILEASNRVGGRIKTLYQEQDGVRYPLELGAGWIHGTMKNPIYDLARENDLLVETNWTNKYNNPRFSEARREFRFEDTSVIDKDIWMPVHNVYSSSIEKAESFYETGLPNGYNTNSSVKPFVLEQFYKAFNGTSDARTWKEERSLLENMMIYDSLSSGSHSMDEVSLKYLGGYKPLEGEDIHLPGGYNTILDVIKENIPEWKIQFNRVVNNITYSSNQSTVTVTCEDGTSYEADHVIVTSSLGYLKSKGAAMFDPPLPKDKMAAIERLGFGTADRIYLEFENLDFIENKDIGILFFVREPHEYADWTNWVKKVFICYVQDVPKANVLNCWITGKHAEEMERKSDDEIALKMWVLLQKFLGAHVPAPVKVTRSKWHNEEFIKGAYTFIRVGSSIEDINILAEPLYFHHENYTKPIVQFAGEATEGGSSAHGAYTSGRREAQRIITSYRSRAKVDQNVIIVVIVFIVLIIFLIAVGICYVNRKSGHRYSLANQ